MRPRFNPTSRTTYTPKENQVEVLNEMAQFESIELARPVIVDTYIYFARPEESQYDFPVEAMYGDTDNLVKGLYDALVVNKIIYDDNFIIGGQSYKMFSSEDWAVILIYEVDGAKACLPYGHTKSMRRAQ